MGALAIIENMGQPAMSLEIPEGQTFDQWVAMGRNLCEGQKVVNWWIGDWWSAGHKYGERAKVAAEGLFGRELGTVMNCGTVSRAFPKASLRNEALSWDHHRHVAPLAKDRPDEAKALLDKAASEGWSTRDLREKVREITDSGPSRFVSLGTHSLNGFLDHWNRLPGDVRVVAAELIEEADGEDIEPVHDRTDLLSVEDSIALIDHVDHWCRRTGTNYNRLVVMAGVAVSVRSMVRMKGKRVSTMVAARLHKAMQKHRRGVAPKAYKAAPKPWGGPFPELQRAASATCPRCGAREGRCEHTAILSGMAQAGIR